MTKELRELNEHLGDKKEIIVFNSEHPIETMFYTDCIAYSTTPDSSTLSYLHKKGYEIYIRKKMKPELKNNGNQKDDIVLTGHNTQYRKWQGLVHN